MEAESRKILGELNAAGIEPAGFTISAQCNRVAVEDGHTESVFVKLSERAKQEDIERALCEFRGRPQELKLPTAPQRPVILARGHDRPQPRFDVDTGNGMSAVVGRIRPCPVFDYKFTVLSHNTIRGAAGAAILNAELMYAEGRL
jgi:aspartate-semialdehyde dehydrogenase